MGMARSERSVQYIAPIWPEPGVSAAADAIRERRGAGGLLELDAVLLHAPKVALGWNALLGAIRSGTSIPGNIRELMVLRIAVRNRAVYEWMQHEGPARDEGVTDEQLSWVSDLTRDIDSSSSENPFTDELERAAILYADACTCLIRIPDHLHNRVRQALLQRRQASSIEQQLVEMAAIAATYNMVSRFLVANDVGACMDSMMPYPPTTA